MASIAKSPIVPFEQYAALDAVNWSTLRAMRDSPAHYQAALAKEREDTDSLRLGRGIHTAVLEPHRFLLDYVLWEGGTRRGEKWDRFISDNAGKTPLKPEQYEKCLAVGEAVRAHPVVKKLLRTGQAEVSITWTDPTGILCKGRLDFLGASAFVDLKSTSTLDERTFAALCARMGYHGQFAFYNRGLQALGIRRKVRLIACEIEPPYDVGVFEIDDDTLWAGEELVSDLMRKLLACRKSKKWPGRYPTEQALRLPTWAFPEDDATHLESVARGTS
jgi:PDDEXK-like domain of unknown function (DUF3799)